MVQKVVIRNNEKSPICYLSDLKAFKNGKSYEFKDGVNVIVGENGCGKTTLLNLIRSYLLVDARECSVGLFNYNINALHSGFMENKLYDGVGVYADYMRNTFRLCHKDEKTDDDITESIESFGEHFDQLHSSTGEGVLVAIQMMFKRIFDGRTSHYFDYTKVFENYPQYGEYVKEHMVNGDEWTILMDEPDRNLSIDNIINVKGILDFHKPQTQIIAVVHNPLLIYSLSKCKDVNMIEMSRGYVKKVKKMVEELVK